MCSYDVSGSVSNFGIVRAVHFTLRIFFAFYFPHFTAFHFSAPFPHFVFRIFSSFHFLALFRVSFFRIFSRSGDEAGEAAEKRREERKLKKEKRAAEKEKRKEKKS
jgi:hypothetical protein